MASYGQYRISPRVTQLTWRGMTKDNHLKHYNELFNANAQNASNHLVRLFSCMHGHPSFENIFFIPTSLCQYRLKYLELYC